MYKVDFSAKASLAVKDLTAIHNKEKKQTNICTLVYSQRRLRHYLSFFFVTFAES